LGLTTTIIGMSVNIISQLTGKIVSDLIGGGVGRGVGLVLFVGILVTGHFFNFIMSILGAFVHPARLILLEFFNRFYASGGEKFQPLGFTSDKVEIVRRATA
ncbi:MAG: hypothetical protein ACYTGB_13240, partial [Planctomycetota bacterium]